MKEQTKERESLFSRKNLLRLIAAGILIAVAASAFAYGVGKLFSAESGYRTVECTANKTNCSGDFIFTYQLGISGISPTAELKAVTNLYNEKAAYYYRLFHASEQFEDVVNVASLNAAPNTELRLPPELYASLEQATADPGRNVYLGPIFAYYDTLFASSYDEDAATWDPAENPELKAEYEKTLVFARDPAQIRLELKGDCTAALFVSEAYLAFAGEVGIRSFLDFSWMKNAFIADRFAEDLTAAGYVHGVISSRDGFIRKLEPGDTAYVYDMFAERGGKLEAAGRLVYGGAAAICSLHPYILDDTERQFVYVYADGRRVTRYISAEDGLSRDTAAAVTFSADRGCAELLLSVLPYYLEDRVAAYREPGVGVMYQQGGTVRFAGTDGFTYTE